MNVVSIKQARENFSEIVERAALAGEVFVVTKFGKRKVVIRAVEKEDAQSDLMEKRSVFADVAGMWADREEIKDGASWTASLRKKEASRNE